MKLELSAFMDGAQDETVAQSTINALKNQPDLLEVWDTYHLIGDALRQSPTISPDFSIRVMDRLATEPTVVARVSRRASTARRLIVPLAASVMGVAAVGWVAQALNSTEAVPVVAGVKPEAAPPARIALMPEQTPQQSAASEAVGLHYSAPQAREYLFVHDGYSPRSNIQGVGHYLRSVSDSRQSAPK